MVDAKVGIIVTARVKSNRLPEKVLQEISGKKCIEILLDHIINDKYDVVLAIPDDKDNDILEKIGRDKGVIVYRGQNESPLHRIAAIIEAYEYDHIVRITADDILIDQTLLRNQINFHIRGGYDYTNLTRCPEGIAGEVIKSSALLKAARKFAGQDIEHISYYIKTKDFSCKEYFPPFEYQHSFRLTLDYPEDLTLLRIIYLSLAHPIGTLDIINFLKGHKYLLSINAMPKVTIYVCAYNQIEYIEKCLSSIMRQTFKDFELILLDDNSTDESFYIAMEYISTLSIPDRKKITILRNDHNIGLPASCNKVLDIARGRYIIRVDSDDYIEPTAIEDMYNELELDFDAHGVASWYKEIDPKGILIKEVQELAYHPACCLLDKKCVNELKYREDLSHFEGAEFFKRFNERYNIKLMPKYLWNYRRHPGQKSSEENRVERAKVKESLGLSSDTNTSSALEGNNV